MFFKPATGGTYYLIFCICKAKSEEKLKRISFLSLGSKIVLENKKQVYDYKNGNELIPENEQYSRYKKNSDGTYSIKNSLENIKFSFIEMILIF